MEHPRLVPSILESLVAPLIEPPVFPSEADILTGEIEHSLSSPRIALEDHAAGDALMTLAIYANMMLWNDRVSPSIKDKLLDALVLIFEDEEGVRELDAHRLFWDTICRRSGDSAESSRVRQLLRTTLSTLSISSSQSSAITLGIDRLEGKT